MSTEIDAAIRTMLQEEAEAVWIVGLSGGVDSTVLLHRVREAARVLSPVAVHAVHLNHRIRGEEAEEDADFCRRLCAEWGVACTVRAVDVPARAAWTGMGLEEAGRAARLEVYAEVAAGYERAVVLLAHHADDQAETVWMRLLRGAGVRGLAGMRARTGIRTPSGTGLTILRPLLPFPKRALLELARLHALPWREDASNTDPSFLRNRIRSELVPLLEGMVPEAGGRVCRTAACLREVEDFLETEAQREADRCLSMTADGMRLRVPGEIPLPVLRRVVELMAEQLLGAPGYAWNAPGRVVGMLRERGAGMCLELPGGLRLYRTHQGWIASCAAGASDEAREPGEGGAGGAGTGHRDPDVILLQGACPIRARAGALTVLVEERHGAEIPQVDADDPQVEWFDAGAVCFPLVLRARCPGDRMHPLGAAGSRKVKAILIDAKASLYEKERARILADAQGVLWVWPWRRSERGRITARTEHAFRVEIRDTFALTGQDKPSTV